MHFPSYVMHLDVSYPTQGPKRTRFQPHVSVEGSPTSWERVTYRTMNGGKTGFLNLSTHTSLGAKFLIMPFGAVSDQLCADRRTGSHQTKLNIIICKYNRAT